MKIDHLCVKNFKCFEHQELYFSPGFNVLIGNNGSGKTTVLDALAVGISLLLDGFGEITSRAIGSNEVRIVYDTSTERTQYRKQYPVEVQCVGTIPDGKTISWQRCLSNDEENRASSEAKEIIQYAKQLQKQATAGNKVVLPLLSYYSPARLSSPKPEQVGTVKPATMTSGYVNCLAVSTEKVLMAWIKTMTIAEIQRKKPLNLLEGLKQAIKNSLKEEGCEEVYFDVETDELLVIFTDGQTLPYHLLSDGLRTMLLMVADIAYRACELNPHLGKSAIVETPGIVLIDEIDLHLHPTWQRRVVRNLQDIFPKIQFIATTHSPIIIQSLKPGEVINLNKDDIGEYYNKGIEDILEWVMGVANSPQSERRLKMTEAAKKYYRLLEQAKQTPPEALELLKARLDELAAPYSDNIAYHAFLQMKREVAGLGETDNASH
jgi:predicted ATP-binding protein involved in virulence